MNSLCLASILAIGLILISILHLSDAMLRLIGSILVIENYYYPI